MKYLQGLNYVKPFLKKIKYPIQTITNPVSGKTITKCTSKQDCNTDLNIVLNNYYMPLKTITNPITGKTITKCTSKEDCTTNLNIILNNYDMHPNTLVQTMS
tara:strand:- start:122 stop:427 length:306 start_codon:yes stop_codon:yes gene_type:complete